MLLMGRDLGASIEKFERIVREIKSKSMICMVYLFSRMEIKVLIEHFVQLKSSTWKNEVSATDVIGSIKILWMF